MCRLSYFSVYLNASMLRNTFSLIFRSLANYILGSFISLWIIHEYFNSGEKWNKLTMWLFTNCTEFRKDSKGLACHFIVVWFFFHLEAEQRNSHRNHTISLFFPHSGNRIEGRTRPHPRFKVNFDWRYALTCAPILMTNESSKNDYDKTKGKYRRSIKTSVLVYAYPPIWL